MVKQINSDEFKEVIKEGKVVVDLFATWCGPCKMLSPVLDEISEEITTTKFFKIDVDDNEDVAREYNVMSIPTVLVFENGNLVYTDISLFDKKEYCKKQMETLYPEIKRLEKPHKYYVDLSEKLLNMKKHMIREAKFSY